MDKPVVRLLALLSLFVGVVHAEPTKLLYNPFTGKLDYITRLSSSTLSSGSTNYIQNTSTLQSGSSFYVLLGSATSMSAQSIAVNDYRATGIFIDPDAIRIYRTTGANACLGFWDASSPITTEAWGICRNLASVTIGPKNVTGGFNSRPFVLDSDGGSLVNESTVTVTGRAFVDGQLRVRGTTSESYIATFSTQTLGVVPYSASISTNGILSAIGLNMTGSPPTLTSCGSGATIVGNNYVFTITGGTGSTGCIATFTTAFINEPTCLVSQQSMSLANALTYTVSNTALTVSQTGLETAKLDVVCISRD